MVVTFAALANSTSPSVAVNFLHQFTAQNAAVTKILPGIQRSYQMCRINPPMRCNNCVHALNTFFCSYLFHLQSAMGGSLFARLQIVVVSCNYEYYQYSVLVILTRCSFSCLCCFLHERDRGTTKCPKRHLLVDLEAQQVKPGDILWTNFSTTTERYNHLGGCFCFCECGPLHLSQRVEGSVRQRPPAWSLPLRLPRMRVHPRKEQNSGSRVPLPHLVFATLSVNWIFLKMPGMSAACVGTPCGICSLLARGVAKCLFIQFQTATHAMNAH